MQDWARDTLQRLEAARERVEGARQEILDNLDPLDVATDAVVLVVVVCWWFVMQMHQKELHDELAQGIADIRADLAALANRLDIESGPIREAADHPDDGGATGATPAEQPSAPTDEGPPPKD